MKTCGECKHYCHDIEINWQGDQIIVAYCDKGKYVGTKNSGACECFEKAYCVNCILDGTDACSRGAGRAIDDEICEDYIGSK